MRVLFAPVEVAGVAGAMRDGLRSRGHRADLFVMTPHPFGYPHDRVVRGYTRRAFVGSAASLRYDVLHFQFGTTLLEFLDCIWGRFVGRPLMLMHYWGDDCRLRDVTMARYTARGRIYDVAHADDRQIRRRLKIAGKLCAAALVSDLELLDNVRPFFPAVYLMPTPIRIPEDRPERTTDEVRPVVIHAPSDRVIKGTAEILAAVNIVARERHLRLQTITAASHADVIRELARADIAIDQLNSDTFGVFALEAMALGKPVLTEMRREALAPFARHAPLIEVTRASLADRLRELLDDVDARRLIGRRGASYVRQVHAAEQAAVALEHVYSHAQSRPQGVFEATPQGVTRYAAAST